MALSLFQYIGLGLVIALVLIPTVRWFWKRFDMPSKFAIEIIKRRKEEAEESKMWAVIGAQVQAEEDKKRQLDLSQKEKAAAAGKSLDIDQSVAAWNKLGIEVNSFTEQEEKETSENLVKAPVKFELTMENALKLNENSEEPDWELIEKMSNLGQPIEGVPEAPDLDHYENKSTE